ncbi:hypothetical protein SKAU_G00050100 [Synaphobranchus kaupii]|uniref:Uncharacterized protein n=1 Tax=Synaphobranchus kaupii TaxID=118154 RepID=A0A9Q1J9N9_SYNKA|nr:hypothetical protein SKAU_G00050100 [Synaphobranchus kaupii]
MFAVKCEGCKEALLPSDLILKAGGYIYHPNCLCCSLCNRLLMPGDHFTLGSQGLCCQAEHRMQEPQICAGEKHVRWKQGPVSRDRGRGAHWDRARGRVGGVRVRTVLSDGQLRALRSCYSQTPRPDARVKLRLGQLTGLSPRVIRVWFQNKRCKDKRSTLRTRNAGDLSSMALLYATARPMVVVPPEQLDLALQACGGEAWCVPAGREEDEFSADNTAVYTELRGVLRARTGPALKAHCSAPLSVCGTRDPRLFSHHIPWEPTSASVNKQARVAPQSGPFSSSTGACRTALPPAERRTDVRSDRRPNNFGEAPAKLNSSEHKDAEYAEPGAEGQRTDLPPGTEAAGEHRLMLSRLSALGGKSKHAGVDSLICSGPAPRWRAGPGRLVVLTLADSLNVGIRDSRGEQQVRDFIDDAANA